MYRLVFLADPLDYLTMNASPPPVIEAAISHKRTRNFVKTGIIAFTDIIRASSGDTATQVVDIFPIPDRLL